MWNLWKPFPAEPQVFNLFYGDKNATLLKLLSELNEMVDVKHLFSINPPSPPPHNRLRRQLPFYPVNAQFTSSHIPWKCGRNFGKPLTGDYLCLVCWSLLVMWPGRSPLTLLSSVTAYWHYSWAICLRLSLPIFLLWCTFTLIFTALKMVCGFEGVLSKSVASLKGHYPFEGNFYPELISFILRFGMLGKRNMRGNTRYLPNPYFLPFTYIFLVKCAWYVSPVW